MVSCDINLRRYILKLTIVSGKNPFSAEPSGTLAYISGLIEGLRDKRIDIAVIGSEIDDTIQRKYNINCIPIKVKKMTSIYFLIKLMFKAPFLKLSKDSIVHGHRPDFMLPFVLFWRKNPKVCTLHGIPEIGIKTRKNFIIWRIYNLIERFTLGRIDKFIAVDQLTKDHYSKKRSSLKDKIEVIPIGIDTNMFKPSDKRKMREYYGFDQEEKIILFIGRFSIEKGLDILLKAFKDLKSEIPEARLILLGEGAEERRLRKIVETKGIKDVTFMKPIEHQKIPDIINCADVLALCSSYEGMPTVVLEAFACGVPVVSTDVGDVNKVVSDKTGYILKEREPTLIKNAFGKVINNGRDSYSDSCIAISRQYSWEKISREIMEVYKDIVR